MRVIDAKRCPVSSCARESPNFIHVIKTRGNLRHPIFPFLQLLSSLLHISLPIINPTSIAHALLRPVRNHYVAGPRLQRRMEAPTVVSDTVNTTLTRAGDVTKYLVDARHSSGSRVLGSTGLSMSTDGGIVVVNVVAMRVPVLVMDFWNACIWTPLRHELAVLFFWHDWWTPLAWSAETFRFRWSSRGCLRLLFSRLDGAF